MKENEEKIKQILIEELTKVNNCNYMFVFNNLIVKLKTNFIITSLLNDPNFIEVYCCNGDLYVFDYNQKNKDIWLSYAQIWSKIENETRLNYFEISKICNKFFEQGFKLKRILIKVNNCNKTSTLNITRVKDLEESFKIEETFKILNRITTESSHVSK